MSTPLYQIEDQADQNKVKDCQLDVFRVANILISHALETHREEIDIIAYYGSYAQGKASNTSDLDIFYIPAEGKNPPVGRTFSIQGRLFDFWAIRWKTMESFATGQKRGWLFAPAIVHHAKVLHARSEEQAKRFTALQQKVVDLQKPEARPQMIQRALDEFRNVLTHLGNLRLAVTSNDITDIRHAGWKVVLAVCECLALANQVFFSRGVGHLLEQLSQLKLSPENLEDLIFTISTSEDPGEIANAAESLALGTRQILFELQKSLAHHQTAADVFESSYPELKDDLGKVLAACKQQQPVAASANAWSAQNTLSLMLNDLQYQTDSSNFNLYREYACLYRELGFAELMRVPSGDYHQLEEQVRLLDDQLRRWLQEQAIDLCEFETMDEFMRSI